jgi:hypothetical protein
MKKAGVLLIIISSMVFLGFCFTLFFSETEGTIIETTTKTLTTTGSSARGAPGGSYTEVTFLKYTYAVNYKKFTGSSVRISGKITFQSPNFNQPNKIKVFYPKYFPSISIIDRYAIFFFAIILLFFGVICIELTKWADKIRSNPPIIPS